MLKSVFIAQSKRKFKKALCWLEMRLFVTRIQIPRAQLPPPVKTSAATTPEPSGDKIIKSRKEFCSQSPVLPSSVAGVWAGKEPASVIHSL